MEFTTKSTISAGIPQIGGKSYILVYFPTVVNGVNCLANDFGSGVTNSGQLDCFNMNNMPSIQAYII
jgi:hypothetical protein